MKSYQGGCHCGRVRFEIRTELTKAMECNCTICTQKGALHHRVTADRFTLLSGQESLTLYQSGSMVAKHWFCKVCGIHPFSNPRSAPDQYSVNIRCLDDFWQLRPHIELKPFDGQNWEEAVKTFKL